MPFNYDETKPADTDVVSQFPANERTARAQVKAAINVEHDATTGRHKLPTGSTASRDGITDWVAGSIYLNSSYDPPRLQAQTAASAPFTWIDLAAAGFPNEVPVLVQADAAPTGWTRIDTYNDRVPLIGAATTTGGSWVLSGLTMPDHAHYLSTGTQNTTGANTGSGGSEGAGSNTQSPHFHQWSWAGWTYAVSTSYGGNFAITGDGAWRMAYVKMILIQKAA